MEARKKKGFNMASAPKKVMKMKKRKRPELETSSDPGSSESATKVPLKKKKRKVAGNGGEGEPKKEKKEKKDKKDKKDKNKKKKLVKKKTSDGDNERPNTGKDKKKVSGLCRPCCWVNKGAARWLIVICLYQSISRLSCLSMY
jgi:hypothetical protein